MATNMMELSNELTRVLRSEISEGVKISKINFQTLVLIDEKDNEVGYDLGIFLDGYMNNDPIEDYFVDDEELLYSFDNLYERDEVIAYLEGEVNKVFRVKTAQRTLDCKL